MKASGSETVKSILPLRTSATMLVAPAEEVVSTAGELVEDDAPVAEAEVCMAVVSPVEFIAVVVAVSEIVVMVVGVDVVVFVAIVIFVAGLTTALVTGLVVAVVFRGVVVVMGIVVVVVVSVVLVVVVGEVEVVGIVVVVVVSVVVVVAVGVVVEVGHTATLAVLEAKPGWLPAEYSVAPDVQTQQGSPSSCPLVIPSPSESASQSAVVHVYPAL